MPLRPFLPVPLLLLAAGCSSPEEVAEKTGVDPARRASASPAASASVTQGEGVSVKEDNDLYSYAFAYPAQAGAYPALVRKLRADADKAKNELVAQASEGRADAAANDYPFHPYSWSADWKVVTDLPGYLSLSGEFATYTGGAHGMYGLQSLVWDKRGKVALDGIDLFRSAGELQAAMGPSLCDALDRERDKKRGPNIEGGGGTFDDCPGLQEATVLVGSTNGSTFDRITVWFGPYVAGSYAEGAYELDFPMTAKMVGAVKPAYAKAFGAGR